MAVKPTRAAAAHTAGIFADMTLDGPEIGTLVAVIDRARHLPNRKTMGKQDPYCAMRLGKQAKKTETDRRGGQTPKWDQELRFNVHNSPDYYRLKCSVFNDDKKTDLIGEAWIDLSEVIVPGGGQNDLWHPLQFKGKMAGEIRVEMTYYDSRPQDEAVTEKKRERERNRLARQSSPASSTAAGTRQLGPREVRRRPLPLGPGQSSPATGPLTSDSICQSPVAQNPGRYDAPDSNMVTGDRHPFAPEVAPSYQNGPETISNRDILPSALLRPHLSNELAFHDQPHSPSSGNTDVYYDEETSWSQLPLADTDQARYESNFSHDRSPRHSTHNDDRWRNEPSSMTTQTPQNHSPHSYPSSPPPWPNPNALPPQSPDYRPQPLQNRFSTSPVKAGSYRDSPLRQSMTQYHLPEDSPIRHSLSNSQEAAPPPPPAHRQSSSRPPPPPMQQDSRPAAFVPPTDQRSYFDPSSLGGRSPLQNLDQNYGPNYHSSPMPSSTYIDQNLQYQTSPKVMAYQGSFDAPNPSNSRFATGNENYEPSPQRGSYVASAVFDEPATYYPDGRRLADVRQGSYDDGTAPVMRGTPTVSRPSMYQEPRVYHSDPPVVRPRAVSPNSRPAPRNHGPTPRQSVSPQPYSANGSGDMGDTPFGPDSYEALNPISSPTAAVKPVPDAEAAEKFKEAARQREVEKLRDHGPIIGNDGRVIDPSDHLPADTWAPEPERKNRKPEHVIRFKNKDDNQRTSGPRSSPASARPLSIPSSPYPSPSGEVAGSPSEIGSPLKAGRNRLQKQMPNRPLPAQPFQHSHSSPAIATMSQAPQDLEWHDRIPQQRSPVRPEFPAATHYSTPLPRERAGAGMPQRPHLSEYNIGPASGPGRDSSYGNNGRPRSFGSPQYQPPPTAGREMPYTPPKPTQYRNPEVGTGMVMDPLSAELSTIDIGPSRIGGGRTAARFTKGNGMS